MDTFHWWRCHTPARPAGVRNLKLSIKNHHYGYRNKQNAAHGSLSKKRKSRADVGCAPLFQGVRGCFVQYDVEVE